MTFAMSLASEGQVLVETIAGVCEVDRAIAQLVLAFGTDRVCALMMRAMARSAGGCGLKRVQNGKINDHCSVGISSLG